MGLNDRDYMRSGKNIKFFHRNGMQMVWNLIAVSVVVFIIQNLGGREIFFWIFRNFALFPQDMRDLKIYQLVTATFLHGNFTHILFNMYGMYLFGSILAPYLSNSRVFWLYIVSGVTGNLLHLAFNWNSNVPLLGASGALLGFIIVAVMLEPDRRFIIIFFPFRPIKATTLAIVFIVLDIFPLVVGNEDGIAHLAHLGGAIGGYAFAMLTALRVQWNPLDRLFGGGKKSRYKQPKPPRSEGTFTANWNKPDANFSVKAGDQKPITQKQLDYLLDKISVQGVNSLTEEELNALRQAREQMKSE